MFQAAYIQDPAQLADFVENTSNIQRSGWLLNEELSNSMMKVFTRDGRAAVAFRGTQSWVNTKRVSLPGTDGSVPVPTGPTMDAVNNFNNLLGRGRFSNEQVDLINRTMARVIDEFGPPAFTSGHSRGGAEDKIAKATSGGEYPSYVFNSAPTAAGLTAKNVKEIRFSTDVVSALQAFKATNIGFDMDLVASHMGDKFTPNPPRPSAGTELMPLPEKPPIITDPLTGLDFEITDNLPPEDVAKIKALYDSGIIPNDIIKAIVDDRLQLVDKANAVELPEPTVEAVKAFLDEEMIDVTVEQYNQLGKPIEGRTEPTAGISTTAKGPPQTTGPGTMPQESGTPVILDTPQNPDGVQRVPVRETPLQPMASADINDEFHDNFNDLILEERNMIEPLANPGANRVSLTETLRATGPKSLAGLGLGVGISQLLGAAGVNDPTINTAISSAGAGAGAEAVDIGAAGLRNVLAENVPKLAGIESATKFTGSALLKGMTRGAGEGLVAGMVALPVDMLLNHFLTIHSGGAGMSHAAAGAISSGTAGAFSGLVMGGLGMAAGEASTGVGIPLAVMTLLMTGIGGGLGAIFGKMDDDKIQADKEDIQRQTQFLIALQNNSFDMSKTDSAGLSDNFIQSVQNALNGNSTASNPILTDDEIEKQRQDALDHDANYASHNHFTMKTLARIYQRTNRRFDDMKQRAKIQREYAAAANVYVTAKVNSLIQLSLQEHARENGEDTFTFHGKTMSTSGDYSFKPKELDIDTDRLADIDPNWQSRMDQIAQFSYTTSSAQANEAQRAYSQVVQYRIDNPDSTGLPDSLTQNQQNLLNRFYPDIETNLQTTLQPVIEERQAQSNLRRLAQILHLSDEDFANYTASVNGGADPDEEYNNILRRRALERGLSSIDDYIKVFTNEKTQQQVEISEEQSRQTAIAYVGHDQKAKGAGFYDVDEYAYNDNMTDWSPQMSQILTAHNMNFTLTEFNNYMNSMASADAATRMDAYQEAQSGYTPEQLAAMNKEDYFHLQEDLVRAGYNRSLYNPDFTLNPNVTAAQDLAAAQAFADLYPDYQGDFNLIPNADIIRREIGDEAFDRIREQRVRAGFISSGRAMGFTGTDDQVYAQYNAHKKAVVEERERRARYKGIPGYFDSDGTFHKEFQTDSGTVLDGVYIDSNDTDLHPNGSLYQPDVQQHMADSIDDYGKDHPQMSNGKPQK